MSQHRPLDFGGFAAVALLFSTVARTLLLVMPSPAVAVEGIPAYLLMHCFASVLAIIFGYLQLVPYQRLERSVYDKRAHRSFWEYGAILASFVDQALLIWIQHGIYVNSLKSSSFVRTPPWVIAVIVAFPLWVGIRLKTRLVFRAVVLLFIVQLLMVPLYALPSIRFDAGVLSELLVPPTLGSLRLFPLIAIACSNGAVLLLVNDSRAVRMVARYIIPVMLVHFLFGVGEAILISGTVGADLLRIEAAPLVRFLRTVRTPPLERFDLVVLFFFALILIGSTIAIGRAMVLGLRAFGIGEEYGALLVTAFTVYVSQRATLPHHLEPLLLWATLSLFVSRLSLLLIPKAKGSSG